MDIGLCQPSNVILLVSVAGSLYHLLMGQVRTMLWWVMVGLFGTGIFQALCFGGLEPVAWVLMFIPILVVCFFLAVALFASRMRIENIMSLPCDRCGHPQRSCGCGSGSGSGGEPSAEKPRCNRTRCGRCGGCGCPYCVPQTGPSCPNCPVVAGGAPQGLENSPYVEAE
jgi:hypothetical protein